tara:strand:+ start:1257 stop:1457 length:201 start_codon:yes stop_codon:yes gene_type:complete
MKFPKLETMIKYGIYTICDLVLFSQGKLIPRNINILEECEDCSFVFESGTCPNCNDLKRNSLLMIK